MHFYSKIFEKITYCDFPISTIFGPRCDLKMPLKSRKMGAETIFFVHVFFVEYVFGRKAFGPKVPIPSETSLKIVYILKK